MPRNEPFEMWVAQTPEEVRDRLKPQVEFRLFPEFGRQFGLTRRPLGGRVSETALVVALNRPRLIATMNPRVKATLQAEGGGTRISGEVGMSLHMVWYLRMSFILGLLMVGGAIGGAVTGGPTAMLGVAGFFGFVIAVLVFGLGLSVSLADGDVDELSETVRTLVDTAPLTEADRAAVHDPVEPLLEREAHASRPPVRRPETE